MNTKINELSPNSRKVVKQVFKKFADKIDKGSIINGTVEILDAKLILNPYDSELQQERILDFAKRINWNE